MRERAELELNAIASMLFPVQKGAREASETLASNHYWGATCGLPLFSSPGEVAGGASGFPLLLVATPVVLFAGGSLGGAFRGSGVSAAKAVPLLTSIAAKSKF